MKKSSQLISEDYAGLLAEVKERIRSAQYDALRAVNKELVALYWDLGRVICKRQADGTRWGKAIVERLAADLRAEFPGIQGFSSQNLWYMRQFYLAYHGHEKLQPLVGEISWAMHLVILGKCKDILEREFYIRMTKKFGWTKSVLIHQIENQSYERTLLGQTNFDKEEFLHDLKAHIRSVQVKAILSVSRELILLYWQIGRDILRHQKEEGWGAKVIDRLAIDLRHAFPEMQGFSSRNLKYMRAFSEAYPEEQFVQQVAAQIPWFHNCLLLDKVEDLRIEQYPPERL